MLRSRVVRPSGVAFAIQRVLQALLFMVIIGSIYRYCWLDITDPFKCGALLNEGDWLDSDPKWSTRNRFQNWQPPGCMMREYKKLDIQQCFQNRSLVFIGDSTIRQIFWAVAHKLDKRRTEIEMEEMLEFGEKHNDLEFSVDGVNVEFVWDPWLNSTRLERELKSFKALPANEALENGNASAASLLLGAPGLWYSLHGQENFYKDFRDSVDAVITYMDPKDEESKARYPFSFRDTSPNLLLLAPIQVPWYPFLSPSREEAITPEKIDQMNDYLQQTSAHSRVDIMWSYSLMSWDEDAAYEEDGLHVVHNVARRKADVLLNLRCNAAAAKRGYPFDATCCSNYKKVGAVQLFILFVGMILLPILMFVCRTRSNKTGQTLPTLMAFALILCYCFYADRTQIFEKAQKQFRRNDFLAACLTVAVAGIVSIKKNKSTLDPDFLPREQTDEWKGWMQFLILIYHYTHASQTLWIYEIIRILVASYLFLIGFGHTLYFLRKDDYSLKRAASVLVRLNLLSCVLPYVMNTNYLFYYFAPLASFWFFVIYFTLRISRGRNTCPYFLVFKTCISALLITGLTMIPGILEFVDLVLRSCCNINWDMREWRFRTFLDLYIVYVGMVTAVIFDRIRRLRDGKITVDTLVDEWLQTTIENPRFTKSASTILSLICIPGYYLLTSGFTTKQQYNTYHPFISFIPILSFLTLRNSHQLLRNYHSSIFAWLGKYSLETYVLQYHIWLAGDTKGLLRIGIWYEWVEVFVLTAIFLWVCSGTGNVVGWLTGVLVDGSDGRGDPGLLMKVKSEKVPRGDGIGGWGDLGGLKGITGKKGLGLRLVACVVGLWVVNMYC